MGIDSRRRHDGHHPSGRTVGYGLNTTVWDAMIIEAAHRGGCGRTLIEDLEAGPLINDIEFIDPFAD